MLDAEMGMNKGTYEFLDVSVEGHEFTVFRLVSPLDRLRYL